MGLTPEVLEPVVRAALAEDVGSGDVTTDSVVPADARCRATLELEEPGVVCGVPAVRAVFEALDPDVTVRALLDEGARIVAKFGRLRGAVPIIRHHHERWDGAGYPDGLGEDEIPLEAAIVGLADAWDAMTTDRPYHRALSVEEALAEIGAGRGTQFAPAVVDAFFAIAARRPAEVGLDEPIQRAG